MLRNHGVVSNFFKCPDAEILRGRPIEPDHSSSRVPGSPVSDLVRTRSLAEADMRVEHLQYCSKQPMVLSFNVPGALSDRSLSIVRSERYHVSSKLLV